VDSYKVLGLERGASREEVRAAFRKLARRWHPDRFPAGPERDWASEKMADINAAYRACLCAQNAQAQNEQEERAVLAKVRRMLIDGEYAGARSSLMGVTTRCAEWNYLFGALLLRMREYKKAVIYLSVAVHQQPGNAEYDQELSRARRMSAGSGRTRIATFFHEKAAARRN